MYTLRQRLLAEFIGTAFLLMAVVGGGIAAARLSPTDVGLQLFEAAVVTAFSLIALIWMFGTISGAHFNPAVTLADVVLGNSTRFDGIAYVGAQVSGGIVGTILANLMFELSAVSWSETVRDGSGQWIGEVIATVGLLLVIFLMVRAGMSHNVAIGVGVYVGAAYFFTSSTSFANPAVTIARMFSDTFAGIAPASVVMFILMQLIGVGVAVGVIRATEPTR
jgi:arsenate reductase